MNCQRKLGSSSTCRFVRSGGRLHTKGDKERHPNLGVSTGIAHIPQQDRHGHPKMTSLNLSLDQHALPGRSVPTTAGGFLSYPSKIRSLREPPAVEDTKFLVLDLGLPRVQHVRAGEGRRVRESLEEMSDIKAASSSVLLDPTSSQVVQHFRQKAVKRMAAPSLIGGDGFAESLTRRNLDSLSYARMRRNEVDTQTNPAFAKLDLSDLSAYQKWVKTSCDPFLKELRQAILSNRPEDIGEFTLAWTLNYVKGQPWLPGEEESTKLAESKEKTTQEAKDP